MTVLGRRVQKLRYWRARWFAANGEDPPLPRVRRVIGQNWPGLRRVERMEVFNAFCNGR